MVVTSRESRNDVEMSAAATNAALALSLSLSLAGYVLHKKVQPAIL